MTVLVVITIAIVAWWASTGGFDEIAVTESPTVTIDG